MQNKYDLYKDNKSDVVSWVDNTDFVGQILFTFDGKRFYNLFEDYPYKMTPEQVRIFDKENPFWADFFKDRKGQATRNTV